MVWERPEPVSAPAPSPLSRERIVGAAISLADRDGLAAVSLRKIGASLDAGPMRLYGYIATKDELIELMVDAIYGEMAWSAPPGADWRAALRSLARRTRQTALGHPWFVELLGGRPHLGPHALAHLEASLAALDGQPEFGSIDEIMQTVSVVTAYIIGALHSETSEQRAELSSALNQEQWQSATGPYLHRLIATGRFPNLARVVADVTHLVPEEIFDQGLELVLDGIASRLVG